MSDKPIKRPGAGFASMSKQRLKEVSAKGGASSKRRRTSEQMRDVVNKRWRKPDVV